MGPAQKPGAIRSVLIVNDLPRLVLIGNNLRCRPIQRKFVLTADCRPDCRHAISALGPSRWMRQETGGGNRRRVTLNGCCAVRR